MIRALIPARVGSKGVPNKNWKPLNGKSCVQRAVECAQAAGIDSIHISTDGESPREPWVSDAYWHIVGDPIHQDDTPMGDVISDWEDSFGVTDNGITVLLQPSSPLRTPEMVREAIAMIADHDDRLLRVFSAEPVPLKWHADYQVLFSGENVTERDFPKTRQELKRTFRPSGSVYAWRGIFPGHWEYAKLIIDAHPLSIDTPEDWAEAEQKLIAIEGDRRG